MTGFDAMRETIYAEVATLISQNETSPHFLIELFRQLQLLSTDFLRQRALYAIQEIVARYFAKVSSLRSLCIVGTLSFAMLCLSICRVYVVTKCVSLKITFMLALLRILPSYCNKLHVGWSQS